MAEITNEVAVISENISNILVLQTIAEQAGIVGETTDTVIAIIAETAVITDPLPELKAYALTSETAQISEVVSGFSSFSKTYNEVARITDAIRSRSVAQMTTAEVAVITGDAETYTPREVTAETALLGDTLASTLLARRTTREVASIAGSPVSSVYATFSETAVIEDGTTVTQTYVANVAEVAGLSDALVDRSVQRALYAEIAAIAGAPLAPSSSTVAVYAERAYIAGEPVPAALTLGWSANLTNFATTQYVGHPAEQLTTTFAFGAGGVFVKGEEVFAFSMQTPQSDFGDAIGKRCTYIAAGCAPDSEFDVSLVAELPDRSLVAYPVKTWPRGTQRYMREYSAPRGVLSSTLGVRIAGSHPDNFELRSLEMAPLISGRR